jgi:DNA polymerase-3 subunit beta
MDLTIGRKGLLGYLKAVGGSNVVKVIPSNGSASGSQATDKRLKVICGANTSYLADSEWIGDNTPVTLCDVRVRPSNSVKPNVGTGELAEALARVLPFTAREDNRPVLQCVNFEAKDGRLTLVSADGFRLAVVSLDYEDGEGQALISRDDLRGMVNALETPIARPSGHQYPIEPVLLAISLSVGAATPAYMPYSEWQYDCVRVQL